MVIKRNTKINKYIVLAFLFVSAIIFFVADRFF